MTEYKECLSNWNKGTGGGSGLASKFETWSDDKLNKYDIDPSIYDHTDVQNRPSILMEGYTKNKMYLTVMYMWDEKMDFILSAKYDPLRLGRGEAGLGREDTNEDVSMSGLSILCSKTSKRSSPTKGSKQATKKDPQDAMATMVKSVIDAVMTKDDDTLSKSGKRKKSKKNHSKDSKISLNDQSL